MSTQHTKFMTSIAMVFLAISVSNMAQAQNNPDDVVFDISDKKKIFFTPELNSNSKLSNYNFYNDARKNASWSQTQLVNYPGSQFSKGSYNSLSDWDFYSNATSVTSAGGNEWFTYRSQISRSTSGISCAPGTNPLSCQTQTKTASTTKCTSQDISFGLSGASTFPIKHNAASTLGVTPSLGYSQGWSLCQTSAESLSCRGVPGQEVYFTTESVNTFGMADSSRPVTVRAYGDYTRAQRVKPLCEQLGGTWSVYNSGYGYTSYNCYNAKATWKKGDFWPRRNAPILSQCRARPLTG